MEAPARLIPKDEKLFIRAMTAEDLPGIRPIEDVSFPQPWSDSMIGHEIENKVSRPLVALLNNRVVGYIFLWVIEEDIHINNIAVDPECRGEGVGRALLHEALKLGMEEGALHATLEVRPSNMAALSLYSAFGFVEGGRRKKYYWDTGEDALILWLKDIDRVLDKEK